MPTTNPWANRIIGRADMAPGDIMRNPLNFRRHGKQQEAAMEGALREIGWVQQIILNQRSGHLLDGHLRVELALKRNEPTVPVVLVDLDEREERLALATFDPIGALAETDAAALRELMADQTARNAAVQEFLEAAAETPPPAPLRLGFSAEARPADSERVIGPAMCPHCGHEFYPDGGEPDDGDETEGEDDDE